MKQVIFLYDELMTKRVQNLLRLPITFVSFGYVKGKMYWLNDDKKRRYFIVPPETKARTRQYNTLVYGGIFVINDYSEYERALFSYYNSSMPYTNEIMQSDLYVSHKKEIVPIKFKTLKELEECRYERMSAVSGLCFFANQENEKVKNSLSKGRYYRRTSGIDVLSLLTMIKER